MGDIRNDQDAALTYEGENWVLIQQTANILIKIWDVIRTGTVVELPLKSLSFLNNFEEISTWKFKPQAIEELTQPQGTVYKLNLSTADILSVFCSYS